MDYQTDLLEQQHVYDSPDVYLGQEAEDEPIIVEEDVTLTHLRGRGLDYIEDLAVERGEDYVEAYIGEAIDTVAELFEEMGLHVETPEPAYTPEAADKADDEEPIPLARYDPADEAIEVIQAPDEDRLIDVSILNVVAHELWHVFFDQYLRDEYGFVGGERPGGFPADTGDTYDLTGTVYTENGLDTAWTEALEADNTVATTQDLYDGETPSLFDEQNGSVEPLEVDNSMPDIHLGGLDEAIAHVISLTVDGVIQDQELRQEYWEDVVDFYNRHADKYGIYEDRTGSFGEEVALLGEYIADMIADDTRRQKSLRDEIDRLAPLLNKRTALIEDGLLELDLQ